MTLIYMFHRDAEQAPAKGLMRVVLRQVLQAVDLCPDYDIFAEQIRQHSTMGLWGPSLDPREMTAIQREIWQRYDARGVTAYPQLLKREVLYNNEHTLCIRDWLGPNARDMRGDIRVVDREVDPSEPDSRGIFPIPRVEQWCCWTTGRSFAPAYMFFMDRYRCGRPPVPLRHDAAPDFKYHWLPNFLTDVAACAMPIHRQYRWPLPPVPADGWLWQQDWHCRYVQGFDWFAINAHCEEWHGPAYAEYPHPSSGGYDSDSTVEFEDAGVPHYDSDTTVEFDHDSDDSDATVEFDHDSDDSDNSN
eukprot:SAG25_NODE_500_length_7380_cov_16.363137_8_plen_303_part_00